VLVSLFTDASRCGQTGASGYGYWAKSKRKRTYGGGALRAPTLSANHAELQAICNGLHCCIRDGVAEPYDTVLIQTDNMHSVQLLSSAFKPRVAAEKLVLKAIWALATGHNITIQVRHVKGHVQRGGARHFVNGTADRIARKAMLSKRKELQACQSQSQAPKPSCSASG
jgi:ribonuclease HI